MSAVHFYVFVRVDTEFFPCSCKIENCILQVIALEVSQDNTNFFDGNNMISNLSWSFLSFSHVSHLAAAYNCLQQ